MTENRPMAYDADNVEIILDRALTPDEIKELAEQSPDFVQEDGTAIYTTP